MTQNGEKVLYEQLGMPKRSKRSMRLSFESYDSIYRDYYHIYSDYLLNLLMSMITYDNLPDTFNVSGLEWILRTTGYANITAFSKDNIFLESVGDALPSINREMGSVFGAQYAGSNNGPVKSLISATKKPVQLTPESIKQDDLDYPVTITIPNKINYYNTGIVYDVPIIDRTAKTLAEIKASTIANIRQQKTPFIGFTKEGNITDKQIWEQLQNGDPLIRIDSDVTDDVNKIIKTMPVQTPNLEPTLKDSWNDTMNEFLTFVGLDSVPVDKKERLVASEADSNDQQVSLSASIYLDARNNQLKLLNKFMGTNIKARLNLDTLQETLDIINRDAPKDEGEENETGTEDNN